MWADHRQNSRKPSSDADLTSGENLLRKDLKKETNKKKKSVPCSEFVWPEISRGFPVIAVLRSTNHLVHSANRNNTV